MYFVFQNYRKTNPRFENLDSRFRKFQFSQQINFNPLKILGEYQILNRWPEWLERYFLAESLKTRKTQKPKIHDREIPKIAEKKWKADKVNHFHLENDAADEHERQERRFAKVDRAVDRWRPPAKDEPVDCLENEETKRQRRRHQRERVKWRNNKRKNDRENVF